MASGIQAVLLQHFVMLQKNRLDPCILMYTTLNRKH